VSNEDRIIDNIIRRERAPAGQPEYTNRASDRGGPTKFGVTQLAWDNYRARSSAGPRALSSVEHIDENDAREFYRIMYVRPLAWIDDYELHDLVADCAVLHGATRAVRWLQSALGVATDGVVGAFTRMALHDRYRLSREIANDVLRTRLKFIAQIATDQRKLPGGDPDAVNLNGWVARCCEFIR
jgi:lysozyme family protein